MNKIATSLKSLPDKPGIYLFFDSKKEIIYVGKATSLKQRVKSYFSSSKKNSRPIEEFTNQIKDVKWEKTDSVIEAIILEANIISKTKPKYNVLGKDDKSWNYFVITKDSYPKFYPKRQHEYQTMPVKEKKNIATIFGPYPTLNTRAALNILRRLFRYSTCKPAVILRGQQTTEGYLRKSKGLYHPTQDNKVKPCFYYQMGQCLGVCTGEITPTEYRRLVINPLKLFLNGKKKKVVVGFEQQMKAAAKVDDYETAARLRDQLKGLKKIQDIALLNKSFVEFKIYSKQQLFFNRLEGYDISNLGKRSQVGSMVVFDESGPLKSAYRKFIIKTVPGQNDVDSLKEVLLRRMGHPEWPLPRVILIDGGRAQVNAAKKVLRQFKNSKNIFLLGIAKGKKRERNDIIIGTRNKRFIEWLSANQDLLVRVRDEAHRLANKFHRQRRSKSFKELI